MKVNMTPNPLDVVTIHASQGDTEARQWEFELHNNGELIDTSDVKEQMVFKAYKGGTEQLLPENGSTPTTSPFKGDIRYPQGLLSDQEFLYRESPTEEDGLAKITDIKGNTLNWNQLVQNGNFADTSGFTTWACTISASNNVLTFKVNQTSGNFGMDFIDLVSGHKYLLSVTIQKESADSRIQYGFQYGYAKTFLADNITTKKTYNQIITSTYTGQARPFMADVSGSDFANVYVSNYMVIDLTAMGLDSITDPSDFTSLFPLSYYSYNQGTLLSFMGNGIKTTGKNLFQNNAVNKTQLGITFTINDDKSITVNGTSTGMAYLTHQTGLSAPNIKKGESLIFGGGLNLPQSKAYFQLVYKGASTGTTYSFVSANASSVSINATEDMTLDGIYFKITSGTTVNNLTAYPMLRYADTDSTYEPYTSSTLSLPISTYFPTGMKSAGSVYDELTPRKAITRVGAVDLGSFTWSYNEQYQCFITYPVLTDSADVNTTSVPNFESIYKVVSWSVGATDVTQDMTVCYLSSAHQLRVRNMNFTDPTAFKTAMNGVMLYYELATPTETSFTTASLVTENAEIPLSNNDDVLIGKCTEQLSENPGFIDAKIKLSDSDGECYSNKLQLHVERSPQ